jgi:imidazolonepropionase-like amidohydrolase
MGRTVLSGGRVLDTRTGTSAPASVAFEGSKLTAVGTIAPQAGDAVIDVSGSWLLPGLVNSHAHLGWDGVHGLQMQAEWPTEVQSYTYAMNIARTLSAGVTTVRDLGMVTSNVFGKKMIEDGRAPYLRLLINGKAISTTGGHTWYCCREADGVDDCRKAIREQVKAGATWIKIMACHDHDQFTQAELDAMVDEAHMAGIKVTAHATMDSAIRRVVEAGVDCVEHGGSMSDSTIELMLKRSVWVVTTLGPMFLQIERGLANGLPQEVIDRRVRQINDPGRFSDTQKAIKAGVGHAFGTDAGSPVVPHDEIVGELKAIVKLGMVPDNADAIRSATIRGAQLLGFGDQLGTLEAGKTADVVVVGGDPVADLENLRKIQRVYVRGELAIHDGLHVWPRSGVEVPLKLPAVVA